MITSLQNPLIKRIRALHDKTDRDRQGVFLIEGEMEIHLAAVGGIQLETLVYCPDLFNANNTINTTSQLDQWLASLSSQPQNVETVSKNVFEKLAYRRSTGGLIAVAQTPRKSLDDLNLPPSAVVLVIHGLEKPGNLGAILRTADGAAVDVVCVCDSAVDLYNPNVVRASLGSLFTTPTVKTQSDQLFTWLNQNRFKIIAASPDAKTAYLDPDYTGPTALVVGSEHYGLPDQWLKPPIQTVAIPMKGRMDSLNVSCSAAILLYETLRQRSKS